MSEAASVTSGGSGGGGGGSAAGSGSSAAAEEGKAQGQQKRVTVKVGMVGDAGTGKTSLMVKYVADKFDEDYLQTLGVSFMEKMIKLRHTDIMLTIWDLGGQREFLSMLPLVCNDAVAILFMFDLSRRSSLASVKEWYRAVRGFNKNAFVFLVGTKYDLFVTLPREEQEEITTMARKFAKAMKAPLIFTSAASAINIKKLFKIILITVFALANNIEAVTTVGDPIVEF